MQRLSLTFVTLAVCNILGVAPLAAQFVPRTPPPLFQTNTMFVGVSPLSIPFDIGSVEIEGLAQRGVTVGGVASYTQFQSDGEKHEFATGEVKLRFYPDNVAFSGLSFGAGLGVTEFRRYQPNGVVDFGAPGCCSTTTTPTKQTLDAPTFGMLVDYDWTPNPRTRQFVIGFGVEGKRIIASDDARSRLGLPMAYLAGRLVAGIAF